MPSTVEKLGPSRVKLSIEIPFTELKPHLDKAYADIAQNVNIPGFRRGKVPPGIIDQRFGRGVVLQDAINAALPTAYSKAIEEASVVPLAEPTIEVTEIEDRLHVAFTAEVDVRPDFELPELSSLAATVAGIPDREEAIDERIEVMRQRFATRADVDRPAAMGDIVTFDIKASADGEEIADAAAEGIAYKVGSEGMLDGLEEAVIGAKAGDEVDFSSTLLGGPMKGQEADVHVTVVKVAEEKLPEVDDEFAQLVSEFDTVSEMRADLGARVDQMGRLEQVQQATDKVLEALVAAVDFEVPQSLLDAQVKERTDQINGQLAQAGFTLESYLAENEEEADSPEAFWAEVATNTHNGLKAQIILDKIADDDELRVEQAELTEMLFRRAAQNGTSPESEMQHMMEHNHTGEWMQEIRRTKALRKIVAASTITDEAGAPVDIASVRPDGTLAEPEASAEEAEPVKEPKSTKAEKAEKPKKAPKAEKPAKVEQSDAE